MTVNGHHLNNQTLVRRDVIETLARISGPDSEAAAALRLAGNRTGGSFHEAGPKLVFVWRGEVEEVK